MRLRTTKMAIGTYMPLQPQLSGVEKEWLVRAATGPASAFIPAAAVAALVAAGLGDKNLHGTLDVNAAGRRYLAQENLISGSEKRRR
jgi:hypothetical protein